MKKLLLFLFALPLGFSGYSQSLYWDTKATTFSAASTGISEIRYAHNNPNVIWGYGQDGSGAGADIRVFTKSSDGGLTWSSGAINVGNTTLIMGGITALTGTSAVVAVCPAVGSTAQGGIFKTTNSGSTWVKQTSAAFNSADSFSNIVYFWDDQTGFCQGDPAGGYFEIYTTTNGGDAWTRLPSANIAPMLEGEYAYTRCLTVTGNTVWFGTNKGRMYKSTDRGLNWTAFQTPLTDFNGGTNFAFANDNDGIMITSDYTYYTTSNGGVTWTSTFPEGMYRNYNLSYVPGTTATYVSTGEDFEEVRGSSYTTDGGLTWFNINDVDIDDPINCSPGLHFADATHGVAGGFNASSAVGGIYRWKGSFLANVDFQSTKSFTASPNPTTGLLELSGKNISNVIVYDILGKQVSATNYSALNNVSLNLSALNNGVYMVKVTNNTGNTSTIKVVKQ